MTQTRFNSISTHFNAIIAKLFAINAEFILDFLFINESEIFDKKFETNSTKKILFNENQALKHFDYDKIEARQRQDKNKINTK